MDSSYPSRLRVWDGSAAAVVDSVLGPSPEGLAAGVKVAPAEAGLLFAREALQPFPRLVELGGQSEPFTLQWFLSIESHRHGRHGRWIPRLLEFAKHSGETLLGLGNGLGTDWLQYARHGASVIVCHSSAAQMNLVRHNFELRGLSGRFVHCPPHALPLESASIDVACLSELLQWTDQPQAVVAEVYRVLKPGGKVLAVTAARYDVDFWCRKGFFWQRWLGRARPKPDRTMARYSARGLRKLFRQFTEHRIHKRQLRRAEVPHLWRVLPLSLLERWMGRALVLKAFKPLGGAVATQAAA
jgi:ubiquinone/menaquinone biosynthesis C-methylase UbiE